MRWQGRAEDEREGDGGGRSGVGRGEEGRGGELCAREMQDPPKMSCKYILHIFVLSQCTHRKSLIYYFNYLGQGVCLKLTFVYSGCGGQDPPEIDYIIYEWPLI